MGTIDAAREYYKKGWLPIPLRRNSKAPALAKGHGFLERWPTKDEFRGFQWDGNVGIVCGAISGITVLDLDLPEGLETINRLDLTLPSTAEVSTPNGKHYYLKYSPDVMTGVAVLGKGVDIRNDLSLVVAPPSKIDSGEYVWHVTPEEFELDECPDWMKQENTRSRVSNSKVDLSKKLGSGERNNGLASICGKLVYKGDMDEGLVYNVLSVCNKELCEPPLEEYEVEMIWESIRRYSGKT